MLRERTFFYQHLVPIGTTPLQGFLAFRHCAALHSGFLRDWQCNSRNGAQYNDGSFGPKQLLIRSKGIRERRLSPQILRTSQKNVSEQVFCCSTVGGMDLLCRTKPLSLPWMICEKFPRTRCDTVKPMENGFPVSIPRSLLLAMSGGIDSGVAASLLKERGHRVRGVFMKHPHQRETEDDAVRIAERLGIGLDVLDISEPFEQIVEHFTEEYFQGRTPNPCVYCNRTIKFGILFDHAAKLGADGLATGHYVQRREVDGTAALFCGVDPEKDQSYVLYGIDRSILDRLHFPLGELTKREVRKIADRIGLPGRDKKESQDICFVERGKHVEFLHRRRPNVETSGNFVSPAGKFLGLHGGFERFTVGQRKGMGVGFGERIFVLRLEPETRNVVIGPYSELACKRLFAEDARWLLPENPTMAFRCEVKIRYRTNAVSATVTPGLHGTVEVAFDEPRYGVAPGQAAVFYLGERLLGGATIIANDNSF